ncbi:hypothetical protein D3C77_555100 [compost metagenome]
MIAIKIPAGSDGRNFYIAILKCLRKRIVIHHITERSGFYAGGFWRCRELQTEHRLKIIDRLRARIGVIPMRLIHQHDQIRQTSQIVEI